MYLKFSVFGEDEKLEPLFQIRKASMVPQKGTLLTLHYRDEATKFTIVNIIHQYVARHDDEKHVSLFYIDVLLRPFAKGEKK